MKPAMLKASLAVKFWHRQLAKTRKLEQFQYWDLLLVTCFPDRFFNLIICDLFSFSESIIGLANTGKIMFLKYENGNNFFQEP